MQCGTNHGRVLEWEDLFAMRVPHASTTSSFVRANHRMYASLQRMKSSPQRSCVTPHTILRGLRCPPVRLRQVLGRSRCFRHHSQCQLVLVRLLFTGTQRCHPLPPRFHPHPYSPHYHHPRSTRYPYPSQLTHPNAMIKVPCQCRNHFTLNPPPPRHYNRFGR